jgi:hypothetical protein
MANGPVYRFGWRLANRVRRMLGRPVLPKRCCRNFDNRTPNVRVRPDLVTCSCRVCGCRHLELTADPQAFGLAGRSA